MVYRALLLYVLLNCGFAASQNIGWAWAVNVVQSGYVYPYVPLKIASDTAGYVFVLSATDSPTATPNPINDSGAFVARYNRNGILTWSRKIPGTPSSIAASPGGDLYLGGFNTSSLSMSGAFILKYDTSGNLLWSQYFQKRSWIKALTVGSSGRLYVTGGFDSSLAMGGKSLSSRHQLFVSAFSPAGTVLWLKGGNMIANTSTAVTYFGGYYINTDQAEKVFVTFTSEACENWSCESHWMVNLDSSGNYQASKSYGGYYNICHGLQPLPNGDIMMLRNAHVWTSGGEVQLNRYNAALSAQSWSIQTGSWQCREKSLDVGPVQAQPGHLYIGGSIGQQCQNWRDTVQLGTESFIIDSLADVVISKIDAANGAFIKSWHVPGRLLDGVSAIVRGRKDELYVAGTFNYLYQKDINHQNDTLCFGNSCITSAPGNLQVFLAKLIDPSPVMPPVGIKDGDTDVATIKPNPSTGVFTIVSSDQLSSWMVTDISGKTIAAASGISACHTIDLSVQPAGIYFVYMKFTNHVSRGKLVKLNSH
jgi:hypothetical protein